jgi:hypothetical protein
MSRSSQTVKVIHPNDLAEFQAVKTLKGLLNLFHLPVNLSCLTRKCAIEKLMF